MKILEGSATSTAFYFVLKHLPNDVIEKMSLMFDTDIQKINELINEITLDDIMEMLANVTIRLESKG